MTIQHAMSIEADAAADRYGLLIEGFRSIYGSALDQSHFGSQKQMSEITAQCYGLARSYLDTEQTRLKTDSRAFASEAQRVTLAELGCSALSDLPDAISEHLSGNDDYLLHEIQVQIERDIAHLRQSLRSTFMHVSTASRASGQPLRAALMQYRIGNAAELQFFFHDRRNQKWPSRRFVRAAYRQHLLTAYNETVLMTLAEHGIDTAQILHIDTKSPHHGAVLSVDSNSSLPSYAELKPVVFHPNSEAILARAQ